MSYFNEYQSERRRGVLFYIILMLICAVLGGLVALSGAQSLGYFEQEEAPDGATRTPEIVIPPAGDLTDKTAIVTISEKIGPAVVGISNLDIYSDFFQGEREVEQGTGSGVIFDGAGYIVTNNHVVEGARKLVVSLADGRQVSADVIGTDARTDLAVIKINEKNLTVAGFGNSDDVRVGELAIAIGNPGGADFARSVTQGIISGLNRLLITDEGLQFRLIQTDAAINPGNSGGALVNIQGKVIGINSIKIAREGFEGMGFAIPSNTVQNIVQDLIQYKKVIRPALGVYMVRDVDKELAEYNDLGVDYGVLIDPQPGGPSAQAGMRRYDIIIEISGQKITNRFDLQNEIFAKKVGDTVPLVVIRNGQRVELSVKLEELEQ
ncbi:S1C family serine protease [Dehalobacterium formicoaceticum]|uniref:Trypsin-like peptidase domain-containing protein n=1 Tax=Dehalobacterium formicoaceticum TaxID=51515 RepID=A0ABT1Y3P0_9FIRM|nr:trypsin-like peptidase domain-containing protein [Dehalobacterium formicoaceticum]MCR6545493.1 trypsin-like peptidase domain-containing protein [Dehalobacterium formicoaceticum]